MTNLPNYYCPGCDSALKLYANGDDGPHEDRWTCDMCEIEFPHSEFPLPPGYVARAKAIEAKAEHDRQRADDLEKLAAWNAGQPLR